MIECKSGDIIVIFDEIKGEIVSLVHNGAEYVLSPVPAVEISLMDRAGERNKFTSYDFLCKEAVKTADSFCVKYENELLCVTMRAKISVGIEWRLEISAAKGYTVEWANYPCITVPNTLSGDEKGHKLLWGYNEGVLLECLEDRERTYAYIEPDYPSNGLTGIYPGAVETQFMAYYNEDDGLYFAAHDKEDCMKGIDFYRHENGGIFLQFRHLCGCDFGEEYVMPYPMVMQFFNGDWCDAADIYKTWFEENHDWVPIWENKTLPEWYHNSPVVVAYPVRGGFDTDAMEENKLFPYVNVLPHIERLEREFNSPVMALLMHWEGTAPWAPPIVWPPYGGEEALKLLVDKLHERGDVIGLYCSGIGWTMNSKLTDYSTEEYFNKNQLESEMCVSPKGELPFSKICTGQREGYDLCPARDFTVSVMVDQVEKMVGIGADYIQLLDQNHGGTPYFCYSRNHGHPPTPGKWEVDAMKRLLKKVKERAPDTLLGCESAAAESYIPYLAFSDNRFNLNYLLGRQVPVYSYIFHKYVNNFMGNQVFSTGIIKHNETPVGNLERIAYAFTAGDMLTVVINQNGDITWSWGATNGDGMPEQAPVKTLVRNLNEWRINKGKKYLHTGDMQKPFRVTSDSVELARYYVENPAFRPSVHTSAWKAPDGDFGQFLVNYTEKEAVCSIDLSKEEFVITFQNGEVSSVFGKSEIKIPPLSAALIERCSVDD